MTEPMGLKQDSTVRREVAGRKNRSVQRLAAALARAGVTPNAISMMSIVFAAGCGACLVAYPHGGRVGGIVLLLAANLLMWGRALCNLLDGMVAVEHGRKTRSGAIFNDLPDRIADPLIYVSAGYAIGGMAHGIELGWLTGLLAILTAYARVLAGSAGATQLFTGPMAKQHRMAVMGVALLAAAVGVPGGWSGVPIFTGLVVIVVGSAITTVRRVRWAIRELEERER